MEVEEDQLLEASSMSSNDCGDSSSQPSGETYLVGFVIANIVGLQYYSGTINGRELVGLVREPLNPYDCNAIKVLNTRSLQVGHIERSVAAVLSPLVDSRTVLIEGIVPNSRSSGNKYKIPCQIHVFARFEDFERVKSAVSRCGLVLISDVGAGFGLSEAVVVKERNKRNGNKGLDEIFKLVDKSVNDKRKMMGVLEAPKEVIKSELFLHQKEGLWWLVNRENSSELPPFWEENDGEYVNVLTNYHTDDRPEPLQGGIFADDMGLGKTLTLLSLIAFDKFGCCRSIKIDDNCFAEEQKIKCDEGVTVSGGKRGRRARVSKKGIVGDEVREEGEESGRKGKRRRVSKKGSGSKKMSEISDSNLKRRNAIVDDSSQALSAKTTLVVCPASVFSTWITQLEDHTIRGSFRVYMYYGERTKEVKELKNHDMVLTTYSTLAIEDTWEDSPVKKIEWWRIILDEAHVIKNVNAHQSRAVINLRAKRRWVVTGTPIQNGSVDLFSLMAFLRFEPFSIKSYWHSLVQRPLAQGNKQGISRLQVLMATISLRRTKDKGLIGLPNKTVETHYIELSGEERELYDQMEGEAKSVVQDFIDAGSVMRNYSTVLCIILRLRQICDDLVLCPLDMRSLLPSNSIEDVSNKPELLKKLIVVLQDGEDFDCPICISPPVDAVITHCAHIFCRPCILKTLQCAKPNCPLCRHPLSLTDLFSAPPKCSDPENNVSSRTKPSSKVAALLKLLVASRTENPATKSVVFSQFQKMLVLLEEPLKAADFKILRLDGSMNAKKRGQVIKEFSVPAPEGPTVLLASLKASGAGINLAAASKVYMLEPWWNPAVEEQAMDRVHRIGQKEDVTAVRLIVRNSIEERILSMQESKKKLAREAFRNKKPQARSEVSINDLRALMSL